MKQPTAYHQLGLFIVCFQRLEDDVNNLLTLIADTDDSIVRILTNDLEFGKRLNTADVLFAYFVTLRSCSEEKNGFHNLMVELRLLGERRNELVHSRYMQWFNVHGNEGLLRTNSKLSGRKGTREEKEEELQPEKFNDDLARLWAATVALEEYRQKVINLLYPE